MGISRRNPISNFNWQLRMLKKRHCCNQFDNIPVPPVPPDCCYYAVFDANFGYTIYDGASYVILDADKVGDVVMPSLGGFGNVLVNNLSTNTTICTLGFILPPGDPIPTVDIKDDLGNPVVLNWVPYCSNNCYDVSIPVSDPIVLQIDTSVEGYVLQTWPIMTGAQPAPLDLGDFAVLSSYGGNYFTRLYGPQCVFFVENDGADFRISISNIYTSGPISFITATNTYTFTSGTCVTRPKTYCYTITELTGTCNFSYQNLYGYVFNTTSDPTPIGVCAIEGTVAPEISCPPGTIEITGPFSPCTIDFSCIPSPPLPDCLFYYSPDINVDKWSIDGNGVDNPSAVNSSLNPYGIYYNYFSSNIVGEYRFVISFVGVEPPTYLPVILDDSGNPVIYTLTNCCTKVCLEGTFNSNDYLFFQTGYGWISDNNIIGTFADSTTWENLLKSLYGQQTTYSYIDNGDGTTYITIDNAYICSPIAWSADDVTYQDMVACVPKCLYVGFFDPVASGSGYYDLTGWTLNGNDLITELTSLTGGNIWTNFNNIGYFIYYGTWFYYYGDDPGQLDFTAPDTNVYPVFMTRVDFVELSCDTLMCYQIEITGTAVKLNSVTFATSLIGTGSAEFSSSYPFYNLIDSNDQPTLDQLFKLIYGSQCNVTVSTVSGNDIITITDAYDFGVPALLDSSNNTYTGTYITCP